MCFQGFIRCSCGHTVIIEGACDLPPKDIPFPIKAACPAYQTESRAACYPCGRGRFYCNDTQEGSFFNSIWLLIDELNSRINGLDKEIAEVYEITAMREDAFGLSKSEPVNRPTSNPHRILTLQLERDDAAVARAQAIDITQEGISFVRQRTTSQVHPLGASLLAGFEVSQKLRATLRHEVLAVVDKYDKARKDPNLELPIVGTQDAEPMDMELTPEKRCDTPQSYETQRPLENLVNLGMKNLTSALSSPLVALTLDDIRKRRNQQRITKRRKHSRIDTPSRRTSRKISKVNYAELETESSDDETLDSEFVPESSERSAMAVDSPQSVAATRDKKSGRMARKALASDRHDANRADREIEHATLQSCKPASNKRVQALRGDPKQPPPKFPSLSRPTMHRGQNSYHRDCSVVPTFAGQLLTHLGPAQPIIHHAQILGHANPSTGVQCAMEYDVPHRDLFGDDQALEDPFVSQTQHFGFPMYQPMPIPLVQQFSDAGSAGILGQAPASQTCYHGALPAISWEGPRAPYIPDPPGAPIQYASSQYTLSHNPLAPYVSLAASSAAVYPAGMVPSFDGFAKMMGQQAALPPIFYEKGTYPLLDTPGGGSAWEGATAAEMEAWTRTALCKADGGWPGNAGGLEEAQAERKAAATMKVAEWLSNSPVD